MKIIRLVSDVLTTSIFDKAINTPIIMKPGSKIALKSLSFETEHALSFQITDFTYQLDFTVGDRRQSNYIYYRIVVKPGSYNLITFLQYLKFQMNTILSGMNNTENCYGFEWNPTVVNDKVNFSFGRGEYLLLANPLLNNMTVNNNVYSKTNVSVDLDSYCQSNSYICRGGFASECTLVQTQGGTIGNSVFYVGLCNNKFTPTNKPTLQASDFNFAVFSDGQTGLYKVKTFNGDTLNTDVVIQPNDKILINKDGDDFYGYMKIFIKKGASQPVLIYSLDLTQSMVLSNPYYTFALGAGSNNITINSPTQISSPFISSTVDGKYIVNEILPNITYNVNSPSVSYIGIRFLTNIMQSFLGFLTDNVSLITYIGTFVADQIAGVDLIAVGDDLVVEILNLNLDGYDSLKQAKSSILAIIPIESLSKNGFGFSYIEPFPTFTSMHFTEPTTVNTFSVVIRAGLNQIKLTDKVYMQLLISE